MTAMKIGFARLVAEHGDDWRGPTLHRMADMRRANGFDLTERPGPLDKDWDGKRDWWAGFLYENRRPDDCDHWVMEMCMPKQGGFGQAWRRLIIALA